MDEEQEDDSVYLGQLADRMAHQAWKSQIRRLKHEHHPSRKVGSCSWPPNHGLARLRKLKGIIGPEERPWGSVYSESETEHGRKETAIWSDDDY